MSDITIECVVFNGSESFNTTVYKNDMIVGTSVPHRITNPEFATYTVVVSTEHCGAAYAVSRILQEKCPYNYMTGKFLLKH